MKKSKRSIRGIDHMRRVRMKLKEVLLMAGAFCILLSVPKNVCAAELAHEQMNDIVIQTVNDQSLDNAKTAIDNQNEGQLHDGVTNQGDGAEVVADNAGTVNAPDAGTNNSVSVSQSTDTSQQVTEAAQTANDGNSNANQTAVQDNNAQPQSVDALAGSETDATENGVGTTANATDATATETSKVDSNESEVKKIEETDSTEESVKDEKDSKLVEELDENEELLAKDGATLENEDEDEEEESLVISYTPARGTYVFSEEDIKTLAHLMQHETNGQPLEGKIAVLEVAINRIYSSRFPNTVEGVVYQPGQFSNMRRIKGFEPTAEERAIVMSVINGQSSVLNNSQVLYFRNPWTCIKTKANVAKNWGSRRWFMGIGDHAFYEG